MRGECFYLQNLDDCRRVAWRREQAQGFPFNANVTVADANRLLLHWEHGERAEFIKLAEKLGLDSVAMRAFKARHRDLKNKGEVA